MVHKHPCLSIPSYSFAHSGEVKQASDLTDLTGVLLNATARIWGF